jgi:hypothetical protein
MNMNTENRSIYAMLVRSEEKNRGFLETAIYLLVALSVVVSIWQFAQESDRLQIEPSQKPTTVAVTENVQPQG